MEIGLSDVAECEVGVCVSRMCVGLCVGCNVRPTLQPTPKPTHNVGPTLQPTPKPTHILDTPTPTLHSATIPTL